MNDIRSVARAAGVAILCGAVLAMSGCGGGSSGGSTPGSGNSVAVSLRLNAAPAADCPYGGAQLDSGIDDNGNGVLDADEIDNTQNVCNGISASNPATIRFAPTALNSCS